MKIKHWIAISLLWVSQMAFSATDASLLHQQLARIRTWESQFKQEVVTPQGRVKQTISGRFILQKPNQFVWQIDAPTPQKLISNGRELWLYQPMLKQAIRKPIHSYSAKTPIEFLSGSPRELSHYFHIHRLKKDEEVVYRLRPKNKKMAFQEMQFVFLGNQLNQLTFQDPLGQRVRIQFHDIQQNAPLSEKIFQFFPPAGTDVIQGKQY